MSRTQPPAAEEEKTQRAVQSIEVGGRLLLALADHAGPMTLKDLAAASGLPSSRAHPYLVSFTRLGLVEQDPASGHYLLGPAALRLGLAALHQSDAVKSATPVAEGLAERTGHAVALAVWGNHGPTVIRMIEAREPLHLAMRAGTVMSIGGTATGRAFAAYLPPERLQRAALAPLGGSPEGRRAGAQLQREELESAAAEVAAHGMTRAAGQPIPGVHAFSAPAFDHEGSPAIVLTVLDHASRLPAQWDSASARELEAAAAEVSRRLGWTGPAPAPVRDKGKVGARRGR